ncbi:TIGR01440 family protein [Chengkuizengella sp. SCS-71B]|uniref:TIGR01440 family protein n=1 Tax=Chengkuizengella sp. SCS-71B TaxID=3115290 RepID=UPI0032C235EC
MNKLEKMSKQVEEITRQLITEGNIKPQQIIVIGTSTSEVLGQHIGTSGAEMVASEIFKGIQAVQKDLDFYVAFQCCEHLNRALVVEREVVQQYVLEEVSVIPVAKAGGSMATFAYQHFKNPVIVEKIKAHAGIDIGETLIGMHLKQVAVPLRPTYREIGKARVNMAITRPKLIGGQRAVYEINNNTNRCK